jgi:hypothetical protein
MRITGTLLKVEGYSGTFPDKVDPKIEVPYAGTRFHILDGIEVVKVKCPKEQLLTHGLVEGSKVDLQITVQANQGARGAYLTSTLVGSLAPNPAPADSFAPKSSAPVARS